MNDFLTNGHVCIARLGLAIAIVVLIATDFFSRLLYLAELSLSFIDSYVIRRIIIFWLFESCDTVCQLVQFIDAVLVLRLFVLCLIPSSLEPRLIFFEALISLNLIGHFFLKHPLQCPS